MASWLPVAASPVMRRRAIRRLLRHIFRSDRSRALSSVTVVSRPVGRHTVRLQRSWAPQGCCVPPSWRPRRPRRPRRRTTFGSELRALGLLASCSLVPRGEMPRAAPAEPPKPPSDPQYLPAGCCPSVRDARRAVRVSTCPRRQQASVTGHRSQLTMLASLFTAAVTWVRMRPA